MRITTITLKRSGRALIAGLSMAFAVALLSGCERASAVVTQVGADQAAARTIAFRGRVVGITDGDTITVLDDQNQQHTIRLAEIDAPERGQPWGNRSRQALSALVFGKTISVQQTDTDRYDRIVARLFADGRDVNRAMVEQGHAWAYRQYLTDETLVAVEARARASRVGLWSMSDQQTVAPWEWRQGVRGESGEQPTAVRPQGLFSPALGSPAAVGQLSCSGKRFCRQMGSCAEAHFYLERCGVSSLDGNGDGEPCEQLCGTIR